MASGHASGLRAGGRCWHGAVGRDVHVFPPDDLPAHLSRWQDEPGNLIVPFFHEHSLKKRREFQVVYRQGRKGYGETAVIFCRRREDDGPWRLGLTATRSIGGAVKRNRARRRAREFFRVHQDDIPEGWDFVVNLKTSAHSFRPVQFREDMTGILKKMGFQLRADAIGSFQFTPGASGSS